MSSLLCGTKVGKLFILANKITIIIRENEISTCKKKIKIISIEIIKLECGKRKS